MDDWRDLRIGNDDKHKISWRRLWKAKHTMISRRCSFVAGKVTVWMASTPATFWFASFLLKESESEQGSHLRPNLEGGNSGDFVCCRLDLHQLSHQHSHRCSPAWRSFANDRDTLSDRW